MQKYEFILIGIGLNDAVTRGAECNPPPPPGETCPKGVPSFRTNEGREADRYAEDGYVVVQGQQKPEVLGGSQFDSQAEVDKWLAGKDGVKFKQIFKNVFVARVVARQQPKK